jgi:hypothetical protein
MDPVLEGRLSYHSLISVLKPVIFNIAASEKVGATREILPEFCHDCKRTVYCRMQRDCKAIQIPAAILCHGCCVNLPTILTV